MRGLARVGEPGSTIRSPSQGIRLIVGVGVTHDGVSGAADCPVENGATQRTPRSFHHRTPYT
jgi:hypothetical protein